MRNPSLIPVLEMPDMVINFIFSVANFHHNFNYLGPRMHEKCKVKEEPESYC